MSPNRDATVSQLRSHEGTALQSRCLVSGRGSDLPAGTGHLVTFAPPVGATAARFRGVAAQPCVSPDRASSIRMLKRKPARQLLKSAAVTAIVMLATACAHTSDPVYAPTNAPQKATGSNATHAAPAPASPETYSDTDPTALQEFHPALDAHGTWAEDPIYGTVWTPSVAETGPGFVPYVSGGRWIYGDDYAWSSDYAWGWAPFHYGRWVHLQARGWSWVPGREYAPAWVEWRTGDAYVGWSPAPPIFVWRGGVAVTLGFAPPAPPFVYCGHADLFAPQPGRVVIMGPRAVAIGRSTHFYGAPDAHGHFHPGPPLASLHIAPERVVRATGHERGLARAQAFSRPSSTSHLGAPPSAIRRGAGKDASRARPEGARPKAAHADDARPKVPPTGEQRPKLAHAASPRPKVTHADDSRSEGRAERQAPEPHQAQRQAATRPAARNASPQVTHKPASHSEGPTHEQRK